MYPHLGGDAVTDLCSKLLQSPDVDGTLLRTIEVTPTHTEVRGRAHHAAREAKRVVGEDGHTGSIVVLEREGGMEGGRERGREGGRREGAREGGKEGGLHCNGILYTSFPATLYMHIFSCTLLLMLVMKDLMSSCVGHDF